MGKSICTRLQRRPAVATSGGGNAMSENISDKPGDAAPSEDRRNFLKTASLLGAAGAVAGAMHGKFGLAPVTQAQAQTAAAPAKWWPSKWGATDEAGASNHITPAKVLDAAKLIRDGKIYKIGRTYEHRHAAVRRARLHAAHSRAARPAARSARTSWSITMNISRPRSARSARNSTASAISASSSARTATRARCISTTASLPPRSATPTA